MTDSQAGMAAGALSCAASLLLTPVLRQLGARADWLDRPDGRRKMHPRPVPLAGGVAVMAAVLAGQLVLLWVDRDLGRLRILGGAAIIFIAGLADDFKNLRPWQKLILQLVAAISVWIAAGPILGAANPIVAVPCLLLIANAFNLLDGLDGLAALVALIAAASLLAMNTAAGFLLIPLAGALAGFLPYNLPRASIFLGDSGSISIGFLLGCSALITAGASDTGLLAPAIVFTLPLADTAWAILRRWRAGRSLFQGDTGHLHHQLLARTRSPWRALLLLAGVSLLAGAAAVALSRSGR